MSVQRGKCGGRDRLTAPCLAAIALALGVLRWPVLSGRFVYFHDDLGLWFLPIQQYLRQQLWAGIRFPWCPLVGLGYPISAEPQAGLFYPPNLLLALPIPIGQAIGWQIWTHYVIAAWGAFALARLLRLGAAPALAASIVFSSTGFLVAHLHHSAILSAAAWLPWAWYGLLAYRMTGRWQPLLLVIWCSAAQLLAGQPQIWLLTTASGLMFLGLAEVYLKPEGYLSAQHRRRQWLSLGAGLALGLGIAAVTLLPAADLLRLTDRSTPSLDFVTSYGLCREAIKSFIGIRPVGGAPWEFEGFAGLSTLVLAGVAMGRGKPQNLVRLVCILLTIALAMGLSSANPLYRLAVHLPLLGSMRCAARWLVVISLCLSLMAACGIGALLRWRPWVAWTALLIVGGEALWFSATYNPRIPVASLEPPTMVAHLGSGRVMSVSAGDAELSQTSYERYTRDRQLLSPNLSMLWGVPSAQAYMPLQLRALGMAEGRSDWADPERARRRGVRWLVADSGVALGREGWTQRYRSPGVVVFENTSGPARIAYPTRGAAGSVDVESCGPRGVMARSRLPRPGSVTIAVIWLPWWKGIVNGQEVEVGQTSDGFCSLAVPGGSSTIELRYVHPHARDGIALTALSVLLSVALLVLVRRAEGRG